MQHHVFWTISALVKWILEIISYFHLQTHCEYTEIDSTIQRLINKISTLFVNDISFPCDKTMNVQIFVFLSKEKDTISFPFAFYYID